MNQLFVLFSGFSVTKVQTKYLLVSSKVLYTTCHVISPWRAEESKLTHTTTHTGECTHTHTHSLIRERSRKFIFKYSVIGGCHWLNIFYTWLTPFPRSSFHHISLNSLENSVSLEDTRLEVVWMWRMTASAEGHCAAELWLYLYSRYNVISILTYLLQQFCCFTWQQDVWFHLSWHDLFTGVHPLTWLRADTTPINGKKMEITGSMPSQTEAVNTQRETQRSGGWREILSNHDVCQDGIIWTDICVYICSFSMSREQSREKS